MCQTSRHLTATEKTLLKRVETQEAVNLLQELIHQRSDYPPGDCRAVLQVIIEKLQQENVPFQLHTRRENQPNLIATLGDPTARPCLMLHAHIDTVPAGDEARWSSPPFAAEISDGKIVGRGAGDDKGSVAAQVVAFLSLARSNLPLQGCVKLVIVADEESGGNYGTRWLHQQGLLATDFLVVGEQTNNQVAIAERVACGIDLTVYGKSAHGAMPWAGENAILKTARALAWLQEQYFPVLEQRRVSVLPPATLNIGRISGGIQWSIVAEQCKVEMDRRLLPGETREMAMEEIRQSLDEFSRNVEPLLYELFSQGEVAGNINTPADDPFVTIANKALADLVGAERPLTGYAQTSDGRWFARDGIPIILFGPSDPAVAHATDEFIFIDQLEEATRFLTLLAFRMTGGK